MNETITESKDHIEQKKEAIKEGVIKCLTLLRPMARDSNPITPTVNPKKKIIIKKKTFDILHRESDDEEEKEEDETENDKENQTMTPVLEENIIRRKTVRGSNSSKRSVSSKQEEGKENESPSKRTKTTDDIDEPLPIISPIVTKKATPSRKKITEEGEEKKAKSLRLARKVQDSKPMETTKLIKKQKTEETHTEEDADVGRFFCRIKAILSLSISASREINYHSEENRINQ